MTSIAVKKLRIKMILLIEEAILFALKCSIGFVFMIWLLVRREWIRWTSNLPFIPLEPPYIYGNITREKHRSLQLDDFYRSHRNYSVIGLAMITEPAVLIIDLQLIKCVLIQDYDSFRDRGMFYTERDPLSGILGTLVEPVHSKIRAQLSPAFTPIKIKEMFETIKTVGNELVNGLSEIVTSEDQVEIRDLFSRFTTDVIGKVAIGIECRTLNESTQLREMAQRAMKPHLKYPLNHFISMNPEFCRFLSKFFPIFRKHSEEVSDFFVNVIKQTIQYREENNIRRNDYLQLLIDAGLEINQIAAFAFDFLSAGYADSTSTLSYCLYELALPKNRHIQTKAMKEIQTVLDRHDGQLTYAALHEMVYCKQIISGNLNCYLIGNVNQSNIHHLLSIK